jgi:hypothetical protein
LIHTALAVQYKSPDGPQFLRLPTLAVVVSLDLFPQIPKCKTILTERERERQRETEREREKEREREREIQSESSTTVMPWWFG